MGKTTDMTAVMGQGGSLEEISARFTHWRKTRIRGQHLPRHLWAAAVDLSRKHGAEAVAGVLRVDLERLKARLEPAGERIQNNKRGAQFVEMRVATTTQSAHHCDCAVELNNARGARMRVELNGDGLASLVGLCSAFWSAA
jgi:hypothetical protein